MTAQDSVNVPIDRSPSLDLVKSSDLASPAVPVAGDTITYSFSVTNTGNVDLTDVTVTDVFVRTHPRRS